MSTFALHLMDTPGLGKPSEEEPASIDDFRKFFRTEDLKTDGNFSTCSVVENLMVV